MEKYKIQKTIGSGSFANVSKAVNIKTNEIVAIKKMKKKFSSWEECLNLREIKSLTKLNHPHIMKLKEVIRVNDELFCVFEFCDQNIYQFYLSYKEIGQQIPENQIKQILFQITSGLAYMHKHGFFHRDLKPENILYSKNIIKIGDFGLAREIRSRPPYTDYVATRWYRAPEILLKSTNYNSPVDIYALGCIIAELYQLNPLFSGNSEFDQMHKICSILGTPSQNSWSEGHRLALQMGYNFPHYQSISLNNVLTNASPEAVHLIGQMLNFDPAKRPTAMQILQHPFLNGMSSLFPNSVNINTLSVNKEINSEEEKKRNKSLDNEKNCSKSHGKVLTHEDKSQDNEESEEEELILTNHDPFSVKKKIEEGIKPEEKIKNEDKFENKEVWRGENEIQFVSEEKKPKPVLIEFNKDKCEVLPTKPFLIKEKEVIPFPGIVNSLYDEELDAEVTNQDNSFMNKSFNSQNYEENDNDDGDELKLQNQPLGPIIQKGSLNPSILTKGNMAEYNKFTLDTPVFPASLENNHNRNLSLEKKEKKYNIAPLHHKEKNYSIGSLENKEKSPKYIDNQIFPKLKPNLNNFEDNFTNRGKNIPNNLAFLPEMTKNPPKGFKSPINKEKVHTKLPNLPNGVVVGNKNFSNNNKQNNNLNMPSLHAKANMSYSPLKNNKDDDDNNYIGKYKL